MNRTFLKPILAVFVSAVVWGAVYLIFSFITWNFNPGDWDPFARFICAVVASCFAMVMFTALSL